MKTHIREATADDIDDMFAINSQVHLSEYYKHIIPAESYERYYARYEDTPQNRERYREKILRYISDESWHVWVAVHGDEIVGLRILRVTPEQIELEGLFVSEAARGKGIGRDLFRLWHRYASPGVPVILEVAEQNLHAQRLYESEGFVVDGVLDKLFYGTKLLQMSKH